ncbi:hypothetical protein KC19_8G069000 [Ceratodon purpureus]|uniref:Secreted protein n=1 Tax=Ceratodon purpureus TaxID=3225 RepID=A0A8T0GYF7_CERPU|nr:hypothetical protein KC19_8G069000 [Ceratodon purpureus]
MIVLWLVVFLITLYLELGQGEGFEELESATWEFLELLESPLHDLELKNAFATNWLAHCEQALQHAGEVVDPSAPSGLGIGYSVCD